MSITAKRVVRFLAIGTCVAIGSVVLNSYFGSGDEACAGHGCPGSCPHEVCVSYCWADGTYIARSPAQRCGTRSLHPSSANLEAVASLNRATEVSSKADWIRKLTYLRAGDARQVPQRRHTYL